MSAKKRTGNPDLLRYCLDSSALLTLWNDEPGAAIVDEILRGCEKPVISFMTVMECRYRLWKYRGRENAEEFRGYLELLPLGIIDTNEDILEQAIEIKANHALSVVDSWIIATAIHTNSVLVHKDPEFEQLAGQVRMLPLPYKHKTGGGV
jgi:predicted nucleic acid-binding protein